MPEACLKHFKWNRKMYNTWGRENKEIMAIENFLVRLIENQSFLFELNIFASVTQCVVVFPFWIFSSVSLI